MDKLKKDENVKEYSSKLFDTVNKIRLLDDDFPDARVVDKIQVNLPAKFEIKISTIEELSDLNHSLLLNLISKLQTHERRATMREENSIEGAFFTAQTKNNKRNEGKWKKMRIVKKA